MLIDEEPGINPHTHGCLIFDKDAKTHWGKEKTTSSTNGAGQTEQLHVEERK